METQAAMIRQEPARSLRAGGAEGFENASAAATSVIKPTNLEAASALTPPTVLNRDD
jgi:hypothetical protein